VIAEGSDPSTATEGAGANELRLQLRRHLAEQMKRLLQPSGLNDAQSEGLVDLIARNTISSAAILRILSEKPAGEPRA
jgi:hypothetical protein